MTSSEDGAATQSVLEPASLSENRAGRLTDEQRVTLRQSEWSKVGIVALIFGVMAAVWLAFAIDGTTWHETVGRGSGISDPANRRNVELALAGLFAFAVALLIRDWRELRLGRVASVDRWLETKAVEGRGRSMSYYLVMRSDLPHHPVQLAPLLRRVLGRDSFWVSPETYWLAEQWRTGADIDPEVQPSLFGRLYYLPRAREVVNFESLPNADTPGLPTAT